METRTVDVAVIGAGTAGLTAQRAASKAGARSLLIDRGPLGTTCARVGCMPSKLLVAASEAAHAVHAAGGFGIRTGEPEIDGPAVLGRVRTERDRFVSFVLEDCRVLADNGELIMGAARLTAADTLQVDEHTQVKFRGLVVATGTAPQVPGPFAGLPPELMLSSESLFELRDLPASVLVVGAGPIGLELGQALHRLGVRVTIVGTRGAVGPLRDPRVKEAARAAFVGELELHTEYVPGEITAGGDGVVMRYTCDGEHRSGTWARVLIAAGRRALLGALELERAGVVLDDTGRPKGLDAETLRVGDTNVFLAGDVSGLRPLLHEASDEGHIAGDNAARLPDGVTARPRRTRLGVVFTDPGLAVVGGGFEGVTPETHAIGAVDWGRQGRARVLRKNYGLTRIYATRGDRKLCGAELAGPGAEHMAHLLAWAVQQGLTVDEALKMPFYHPVLEEGLRTALQGVKADLGK